MKGKQEILGGKGKELSYTQAQGRSCATEGKGRSEKEFGGEGGFRGWVKTGRTMTDSPDGDDERGGGGDNKHGRPFPL